MLLVVKGVGRETSRTVSSPLTAKVPERSHVSPSHFILEKLAKLARVMSSCRKHGARVPPSYSQTKHYFEAWPLDNIFALAASNPLDEAVQHDP